MLEIVDLAKRFANGVTALGPLDLFVGRGEIVGVVGTSGCGKSTLLRIIGGLEPATGGSVRIDGEAVRGPRPEIGVVFQEPRLMPWLTVAGNVTFGLDGVPRAKRKALADAVLAKVGLTRFARALPRELSGGMAQRVALARALVTEPEILLLDEPFSALDAFTRIRLQDELLRLWAIDRPTLLFVTHDIDEALALADRVIVLRGHPGRIRRDDRIDLPRPRRRTEPAFQRWKETLFDDLDLSAVA
jgi:sulfonate transport system ATP-binding protein